MIHCRRGVGDEGGGGSIEFPQATPRYECGGFVLEEFGGSQGCLALLSATWWTRSDFSNTE